MKRNFIAALLASSLASGAFAVSAGFYENKADGITALYNRQGTCQEGSFEVTIYDKEGIVRGNGCWILYFKSITILWGDGTASAMPVHAINWSKEAPKAVKKGVES